MISLYGILILITCVELLRPSQYLLAILKKIKFLIIYIATFFEIINCNITVLKKLTVFYL